MVKEVSNEELKSLHCTKEQHANIFNLDHNPDGELPMFCRCGEVDFNDEDLDVNFQNTRRWIAITQGVEHEVR
jgi:hypothetical protein